MSTPPTDQNARLRANLDALNAEDGAGNTTSALDFLVAQALAGQVELCYAQPLIRAAAAAKGSEARAAGVRLKAKFKEEFNIPRWQQDVKEVRAELTRAAHEAATSQSSTQLLRNESSGKLLSGYENAGIFFETSKKWQGVLGLNEFTGSLEIRKTPPSPIHDVIGQNISGEFVTGATRWIERESNTTFRRDVVKWVLEHWAAGNRFHPVRDYLNSIPAWDGVWRISTWLTTYCGSDGGQAKYEIAIARKFLISAIARVMQPGCKADHMLVLEGKTGIGKSSAVRALVPNEKWFSVLREMEGKDAAQKLQGVWLAELSELDAIIRTDWRTVNRFISQQEDKERWAYKEYPELSFRQCVFVGTTEQDKWMRSETGRRFWPVRCTQIKIDDLIRDRDQLWAEALAAYKAGEAWHLTESEAIEGSQQEQRERREEDPWAEKVIQKAKIILDGIPDSPINPGRPAKKRFTTEEIIDLLEIPISQQNSLSMYRVGAILRANGCERKTHRISKDERDAMADGDRNKDKAFLSVYEPKDPASPPWKAPSDQQSG